MRKLSLAVAVAAACAMPAAAQSPAPARVGTEVASLKLTDQFGAEWSLDTSGDQPLLVIVASKMELAQAKEWETHMRFAAQGARTIRVLDASRESLAFRRALKRGLKDSSPIAVDWDGSLARQLGHVPGKALVLTVRDGRVTAMADGPIGTAEYAAVLSGLEQGA